VKSASRRFVARLAPGWIVASLLGGCAASLETPRRSTIRIVDAPGEGCAPLDWPVAATVSSPFGRRDGRVHQGIDLAVPEGTPVRAACGGVVTYASDRLRGYGRLVIVEHAGGLTTVYAHNRSLEVPAGASVSRGQLLAYSGATGHVTAPHLHFEVRRLGVAIDPLGLLAPPPYPSPRPGMYAERPASPADSSTP
jgi:murein DD-endopeptidase MepM/ murein hydrolase activator NlpD